VRGVPVAGALLLAIAVSVLCRTGDLDAGLWIDEGIAVGIASHPLADIPALPRPSRCRRCGGTSRPASCT
jgi:hypothetical protein